MDKDILCQKNPHGCRLVSGGAVCKRECEWLAMIEPRDMSDAKLLLAMLNERARKVAS